MSDQSVAYLAKAVLGFVVFAIALNVVAQTLTNGAFCP
jgi:hypothetical protein